MPTVVLILFIFKKYKYVESQKVLLPLSFMRDKQGIKKMFCYLFQKKSFYLIEKFYFCFNKNKTFFFGRIQVGGIPSCVIVG
jgi:hypothetical protein